MSKQVKLQVRGGLQEGSLYLFKEGNFLRAQVKESKEIEDIARPDASVFNSNTHGHEVGYIFQQPQPIYHFLGATYPEEGGIFYELEGQNGVKLKYPVKGFPFPEAAQANNGYKRLFIGQVRFLAKNPLSALSLLTYRGLESWLREMASAGEIMLGPYFLKDIRYRISCREIRKFVRTFLEELKLPADVCGSFSRNFAHMFENDDAYLLRLQDLANETTKEALQKNFRKEVERLLGILQERDNRTAMNVRFKSAAFLLSAGLWIPKYRRAFNKAMEGLELKNIQMDDGDRYHVLMRTGYNFLGRTYEDRFEEFKKIHDGVLPTAHILKTKPVS
jgi:hypothetical protein